MTQVKIDFHRSEKSRKKIFGGYHVTTATFSLLSLISFFIHPDVVPGMVKISLQPFQTLHKVTENEYHTPSK